MPTETLTPEVVRQFDEVAVKSGLQKDSALQLRDQFKNHYEDIVDLRKQAETITDPENPAHTKLSRAVRLMLREVRCDVENVRKALKADSLARGKAIDGYANVLKYMCEPVEERLLAIEQHEERKEQARIAVLVDVRSAALRAEGVDPSAYNLGVMDDVMWGTALQIAKQRKADRIEAERKAEADRLAREKAYREARAKAEAEAAELRRKNAEIEAKAKAEREAAAAAAAKEREEADRKLAKERAARKAAEDAAAEWGRQQEAKAKAEREAAERKANAPDREKIVNMAIAMKTMTLEGMTSDAGKAIATAHNASIDKFVKWLIAKSKTLE